MIKLYDTLARAKREFVPRDPKRVRMYVCGPTVYGRAHIGNARPAVVFDTLARLLRYQYGDASVVYARNVTDVDDKIIKAAADEGVEPGAIAERYEQFYLEDMRALGVRDPDIAPHATREIAPMIAMIERLIASGNAYAAEGHVLFSVPSDGGYGELSGRNRDDMIAGARVEVAPYKRDPADFVLWKPSESSMIGWESPWGRGRPGWHIECSAMIRAHLGETIDIHGGGQDLIFPHHENEIAQSRCAHGGAPLAEYWVHNGFVDMGAEKMSKSLGNIVTPNDLLEAGHKGETLRLALLSAHYRSPLPWTESLVEQSEKTFEKWCDILDEFFETLAEEREFVQQANSPSGALIEALDDDLNTPRAIAVIHATYRQICEEEGETLRRRLLSEFVSSAKMLGIELSSTKTKAFSRLVQIISSEEKIRIDALVLERNASKQARDFATADRIRDELKAEGILLEDGPAGTTWRRA